LVNRSAFALAILAFPAQAADWQPVERIKHYAISGTTAPELYASIGESGPLIGKTRTIALTNWDLKWRRDYQAEGSACVLKSAVPFLTITTSLPKPKARLSGAAARLWAVFVDGIAAHEKVHGGDIVTMVDDIIAATVGLRVENDPQCKLIRTEVLRLVTAANEAYKAKSRAFDKIEMSDGGNVHRLILGLVNGR
jgi:predicted secreted Zn-dependent protease